jgi:PKD domain/Right handed beta helix region
VRGRLLSLLTMVAVVAALVPGARPAFAESPAPLYVDNTAFAHCSDAGSGTPSVPYCTISAAVAVVVPGQTVNVVEGDYAEHVTVARSGTAGAPITIRRDGGVARITGATAGLTIAGQHDIVFDGLDIFPTRTVVGVDVSGSARITLRWFRTDCATAQPGVRLAAVTDSTLTAVEACGIVLDAATSGVRLKTVFAGGAGSAGAAIDVAGSNNTISGVTVTKAGGTGIRLESGAADNVVADNDLDGQSIGIDNNSASGTAITNNTLTRICSGILVRGTSSRVSVENNMVSDNGLFISGCRTSPISVDIGVYDDATLDTVVDYNDVVRVDGERQPYAWRTPMSLAQFRAASGQAAHDTENAPSGSNIDSANSAAPGFPSTDMNGQARADDPAVPNTGVGPISYADRGADELVVGPTANLALRRNQDDGLSVTADASQTRAGWVPVVSYAFNFGDGSPVVTQATPVATHQYTRGGTYGVSVRVTDGNGLSNGTFAEASFWRTVRTVALLSRSDNRYVSADNAGQAPLIANRGAVGTWEQFDIVQPDDNHVALRSRANGEYVGVTSDSSHQLAVYTETTDSIDLFQLVTNADGTVSLAWNGLYVTAEAGGAQPLGANRPSVGQWEKFNLVDVANTSVSLRAHADGKYVTAESGGALPLIANRTAVGTWEQFDLVDAGNGTVALYSHANGRFVTAESAGSQPLIANRPGIGAWERFTLVKNADGSVSLLATADGRYVTADAAGSRPLIANRPAIGPWEEFDLSR